MVSASLVEAVGAQPAPLRAIAFPALGTVTYANDFGAPRSEGRTHQGVDVFGPKMTPLLAAVSGRVRELTVPQASYGYAVGIEDPEGWRYRYVHLNNDDPGTDNGRAGPEQAFAPGVVRGGWVNEGQLVGWMGDSGNAENVRAHLHFEIRDPAGIPVNPYESLKLARRLGQPELSGRDGDIRAYGAFSGGARLGVCDFDRDDLPEIVTGAGPGGGPHVRTFEADGTALGDFFAYGTGFGGGVDVACGDLDGDGQDEVITGAGASGGPHVRVFTPAGAERNGFFAYAPDFRGGVHVSAGDLDGDGHDEVITGAGRGGGPHVRTFHADGTPLGGFFAFDPGFGGGVDVAGGDLDGDGHDEVITGAGASGGPHVRVFTPAGAERNGFFAYAPDFRGGVHVSAGDLDGDGHDEVITGAGPGGGPHVRAVRADGSDARPSLFAFDPWFSGGIDVGAGRGAAWSSSGAGRSALVRRVVP